MKYKISFQGWDAEFLISEVPEKMYKHFKDNELDVSMHMCGTMEDELSNDICDGINYDTKFEFDRLYHNCGPQFGACSMYVNNSDTDQEVYSCELDEWEGDSECEQDILLMDFESRYIMVGGIFSKGYAAEYILKLNDDEEFDKNEQESVTDEDQSIKSKFLDECEIAFCEKDLYKILCLDKSKATQTDS